MRRIPVNQWLADVIIGVSSAFASRNACNPVTTILKPVQTARYPEVNTHTMGRTASPMRFPPTIEPYNMIAGVALGSIMPTIMIYHIRKVRKSGSARQGDSTCPPMLPDAAIPP